MILVNLEEKDYEIKSTGMYGNDCRVYFKDIIESGYVTAKKAYCLLEGESRPHKSNKRRFRRWKLVGFVNIIFTKENLSPFHNRFLSKLEMERFLSISRILLE